MVIIQQSQTPAVLIGTFNMAQRPIEQDLSDWLATHPSLSTHIHESVPGSPLVPPSTASAAEMLAAAAAATATASALSAPLIPDIIAVALQEFAPYPDAFIHDTYRIKSKIDELAQTILRTLHKTFAGGHRFSLISQTAQVGMALLIFTRDGAMTEYVDRILNSSVGTGPWGMGNKGAIATRLSIRLPLTTAAVATTANGSFGISRSGFEICFINAHLSAHLDEIKRRNDDYLAICRRMIFVDDRDNHVKGLLFEHQERLSSKASSFSSSFDQQREQEIDDDNESFYQGDNDTGPLLPKKKKNSQSNNNDSNQKKRYHAEQEKKTSLPPWEESIFSSDYIFWAGDLNYRLDLAKSDGNLTKRKTKKKLSSEDMLSQSTMPDLTAGEIVHAIKQGHLRQLYSHDQLSAQRKTMNVFKHFHEAPLAFPPTYKFRMGSNEYSITKRVPAWTDRVLWYVHPRHEGSLDEDKDEELDAWDEHSRGLGSGALPMEPSKGPTRRREDSSPGTWSSASSSSTLFKSKSRGTFSSLAKKGGARAVISASLFQPPLNMEPTHDAAPSSSTISANNSSSVHRIPLSTARSSSSINGLSSRTNGHSQQQQQPLTQSPGSTLVSISGEPCTSPLLIHYYTSHPYYLSSDHKPVSALFTLLPHNLAAQLEPNPYGIDPAWRRKKYIGKKLTTVVGHFLRWGFLVLGLGALGSLMVLVRKHLHGW
ncbi:hypothetical protein BX616_001838 [Lobosporangium transversale]|uniref:Endonuclease/exonuclease/phosphatase n=1 Tax=Lobosporangium transversale TaxID=64571 RepID=A0A1Y2GAL1_9FUNG|nr:Endonuclease/exonuclease/phosphatase [Lobosporangium transversale]KAF9917139.1 hypothetical protein BX616_001838 [Lobosporangium transversale]ORZ05560.1 Endonuclease/exonuclease/phosphatase [Lobosporangium transversale]|eukprot:XP_021877134.1 Endonuclease/exonuclease/phosphatase [Lobosporangium transversale]